MTIDPEKSRDLSFKNPGILVDVKSRDPGIPGIPLGPGQLVTLTDFQSLVATIAKEVTTITIDFPQISLNSRDFPQASPSGNLLGLGKSFGHRGWISQYLPRLGGARIQSNQNPRCRKSEVQYTTDTFRFGQDVYRLDLTNLTWKLLVNFGTCPNVLCLPPSLRRA